MDSDNKTPDESEPNEAPAPAQEDQAAPTDSGGSSDTPKEDAGSENDGQEAPADALSRTPEELEEEEAERATNSAPSDEPEEKKLSPIKRFFRKVNLYFLIFVLIFVVAGVIAIVNFLNSQKATPAPNIATQTLSQDALKQLANTDATVGDTSQTLTIQGNAIIAGQTLTRGNLNVAGNFQTAGSIQGPSLTISGASNLGSAQINTLQVAGTAAIQGTTTLADLNVAGTSSFSGAITASQITASKLVLSGDGILEIPNHITFTGPSPNHTIDTGALGNGGSLSINGSDSSGTININTGNSPSAGCFAHISFNQNYTSQPHVIVSPIGAAAGQTEYYVNRNTSGFDICTANAAPANQVFGFDYFVTG